MTENILKKNKKKKGFTLIELIVVIAIIAIISLIAIPKVMGYQDDAKKKADIANAKTIANTTASEITKGDITVPSGGIGRIIVDTPENTEPTIPKSDPKTKDYEDVAKYWIGKSLQTIPEMQYKTNNNNKFYVSISADGTVTVWSASTGGDQVYPVPTTGTYAP